MAVIRKILARNLNIQWPDDLLGIAKKSYADLLQKEVSPENRKNIGLQKVFSTIFPFKLKNGGLSLDFVSYTIGDPEFTPVK
ncbi:MAG: hypothetical protein A2X93_04925 [Deltaproteobacteria bacterium GWC2_56_8]|nr:MAG: hypothetical protein A2X93_04925 [Deltaproteobacteria bacterium GWC2_56_8]